MRGTLRRAIEIAAVPTAALGVAVAVSPSRAALFIHIWLLVVLAISLLALIQAVRRSVSRAPSIFVQGSNREEPDAERFASLEKLERAVSMATSSGYDVHHRLRPAVREIAAGQLLVRRGIDLDREREAARAVLGDTTWELVQADRERTRARTEPGLDVPQLEQLVSSLERV